MKPHVQSEKDTDFSNSVGDLLNTLTHLPKLSSTVEVENVLNKIDDMVTYFPGALTVQKLLKIDVLPEYLTDFVENMYCLTIRTVASQFDHRFPLDEKIEVHEPVLKLFVVDNHLFFSESFEVLMNELQNNKNTKAIMILLRKLLMSEGLFDFLVNGTLDEDNKSNIVKAEVYSKYESVIQNLMSLPTKIANALEGNFPKLFKSEIYCSLLLLNFTKVLEFLSDADAANQICISGLSFRLLSLFLSKVILHFHNGCCSNSCKKFIEIVTFLCTSDGIKRDCYRTLMCSVLMNLQKPAVEPLAIMILQNVNSEVYNITDILGRVVFTNKNWSFVLCTKLPLLSFYNNENELYLINNLILYLSHVSQENLLQLLLKLIQVWSDKFSMSHTSVEQHLYITKLIIVAIKCLKIDEVANAHKKTLQEKILLGIPIHLESGLDEVRVIGMVTGEIGTAFLNKTRHSAEDIKLEFDFKKMSKKAQELAASLKSLSCEKEKIERKDKINLNLEQLITELIFGIDKEESVPYVPPERQFRKRHIADAKNELVVESSHIDRQKLTIIDDKDFELDSDDDLEPYDTSNDIKVAKKPPPAYLRDLRDGLLETKDADIFTSSLDVCEKLIIQQLPKDDASIGLELLEILISLTQTFYKENFDATVFQSCVAITCTYPAIFAEYLCKQFHSESGTYSICHRVLILDILSESAKTLSSLQTGKTEQRQKKEKQNNPEVQSVEQIIRKRLESKTRRFIKHKHHVFEKVNKFSEVAGCFFFPLIYGFGKSKFVPYSTPDDNDHVLLIHYLQTLAVIMCSAQNCPIAPKMAKELFSVSWFLRFHKDPKVRMATLSLIAAAVFNVPKSILIEDFVDVLLEVRLWLEDIVGIHTEMNVEVKMLAGQLMCLVEDVLKVNMGLD